MEEEPLYLPSTPKIIVRSRSVAIRLARTPSSRTVTEKRPTVRRITMFKGDLSHKGVKRVLPTISFSIAAVTPTPREKENENSICLGYETNRSFSQKRGVRY